MTDEPTRESMDARKPWPLFGYAPGHYTSICNDCGKHVDGLDKRAFHCLECAVIRAQAKLTALQLQPAFEPDKATRVYAEMHETEYGGGIVEGNTRDRKLTAIAVLRKALDERKPFAGLPAGWTDLGSITITEDE